MSSVENGHIPDDLMGALRTLQAESIGDFVYTIRDRELLGWDGPRVTAWSEAASVIAKYATPPKPESEECADVESSEPLA